MSCDLNECLGLVLSFRAPPKYIISKECPRPFYDYEEDVLRKGDL